MFFKESKKIIDGLSGKEEEVNYIACHEWFAFGGSNEKGKQNDWIFHNASIDYILQFYSKKKPEIKTWDVWTDNCPTQVSLLLLIRHCPCLNEIKSKVLLLLQIVSDGQYKNRQNFFQCAKKSTKHENVDAYFHNFAKQHGFKNKSDTIGHWVKEGVKQQETAHDTHAHCGLWVYYMAREYIESNKSKFERILLKEDYPNLLELLKLKSPYECTQRFAAYVEDDPKIFQRLKKKYQDGHIIFSDHACMKEEDDTNAIEHTTDNYSFYHVKDDDRLDANDFFPIPHDPISGLYTCRFCRTKYKTKKPFDNHEKICKLSIDSGNAHKICYKYFKCYCRQCSNGTPENCPLADISGAEHSRWLISNNDMDDIENQIAAESERALIESTTEYVRESLLLLFEKYGNKIQHSDQYPSISDTDCGLKRCHWCALANACDINVQRKDDRPGKPRVDDVKHALDEFGGWKEIIRRQQCHIPINYR